jgi:succinate dehydrogenase hydrophobic anchor subunit
METVQHNTGVMNQPVTEHFSQVSKAPPTVYMAQGSVTSSLLLLLTMAASTIRWVIKASDIQSWMKGRAQFACVTTNLLLVIIMTYHELQSFIPPVLQQ